MSNLGTQMMGRAVGFAFGLCVGALHQANLARALILGEGVGA